MDGGKKILVAKTRKLQRSRSALAEIGARDSRAHEFVARSVCGVAHCRYGYQRLQLVP